MRRLRITIARLVGIFRRNRTDDDLDLEIDEHLRALTDRFVRQGLAPDEAARAARRQFGGVTQLREAHREARGLPLIETLRRDVVLGLRMLRQHPAFSVAVIAILALGIGANVAIFTVVNTVLLQPLPFHEPDRLVRIFDDLDGPGARDVGLSVPEFEDLRARTDLFQDVSAILPADVALAGGDHVERIELLGTSPAYFDLLGATAALGRTYHRGEWQPGFLDEVVISDGLWKRQFGADPHAIGRQVRLDEDSYTIVGVMPPGFRHPGPTVSGDVDVWAATGFLAPPFPTPAVRAQRLVPGAIARLQPGLTIDQTERRLGALAAQLAQAYPTVYPARLRWALRLEPAQASLTGDVRPTLLVLLAAVSVVLLMVCVNVASLLVARSSARGREFAIRQALGASRARLVRQLLTESVLVALLGGVAAIVVLWLMQAALVARMPPGMPRLAEVRFDWRMMAAALGLSAATGVLFGLTPALQASAGDPNRDLNEGGRNGGMQSVRQSRARAGLVAAEVALSVLLLIGAGLLIRSFAATLRQPPGLNPDGLAVGQIWIPIPNNPKANRYLTVPQRAAFVRKLLPELAGLPGVEQAALGNNTDVPFLGGVAGSRFFAFRDEPSEHRDRHAVEFGAVSPAYFSVLGTRIEDGRVFTDLDAETSQPVVVVNEAFVRRFSQTQRAVGRRLVDGAGRELEIVGVVGDIRGRGLDATPQPRVYASIFQSPSAALAVFVRTRSDVSTIEAALNPIVHRIDPELPVFGVRTMDDLMAESMARRRFSLQLMSLFAVVALLLSAAGVYGVVAFAVGQRRQEFGIRLALGARPFDILRIAFRPGLALTAAGLVVGLGMAALMTQLMSSLLFGVSAHDPLTFVAVPVALGLIALVACLVPASRATKTPLMRALR